MIKFSKAGKMPCRSWSLQALETCKGAFDLNGEVVKACQGCYALKGNYRFSNVKKSRAHNLQDCKREDWVEDMVIELDNDRYFRWFDSGDIADIRLAKKILEVMKRTPYCNHWLPTRTYKFEAFRKILEEMNALPNVVVRYSSDSTDGEKKVYDRRGKEIKAKYTSSILKEYIESKGNHLCPSSKQEGKCLRCRACWSKDIENVNYLLH
jgi:hypothetical protein